MPGHPRTSRRLILLSARGALFEVIPRRARKHRSSVQGCRDPAARHVNALTTAGDPVRKTAPSSLSHPSLTLAIQLARNSRTRTAPPQLTSPRELPRAALPAAEALPTLPHCLNRSGSIEEGGSIVDAGQDGKTEILD